MQFTEKFCDDRDLRLSIKILLLIVENGIDCWVSIEPSFGSVNGYVYEKKINEFMYFLVFIDDMTSMLFSRKDGCTRTGILPLSWRSQRCSEASKVHVLCLWLCCMLQSVEYLRFAIWPRDNSQYGGRVDDVTKY